MLIATLGPTSAAAGKTIIWNSTGDGQFVLVGAGPMSAAEVMRRDGAGQLVWASDETREWVASLAEASAPEPTSAAEAGMTQRIQSTLAGQAQALGRAVGATKSRLGKKADTDPASQSTATSDPPTSDDQPAYESTPPTAEGDTETTNGSPWTPAVLIATFNETTEWAGRTITREGDVFYLEDHGPVSAASIMEYDRQGPLLWADDETQTLVDSLAGTTTVDPPGEPSSTSIRRIAAFPRCEEDVFEAVLAAVDRFSNMDVVSSERPGGQIVVKTAWSARHWGADVLVAVAETAPGKTLASISCTPKGVPVMGKVTADFLSENLKNVEKIISETRRLLMSQPPVGSVAGLVATFGPGTARAGKTIVFEKGAFTLADQGTLSAADVLAHDSAGHLIWATNGTRGWVEAKSQRRVWCPIETYKVIYRGGHPDYPRRKASAITFRLFRDRFEFQPREAAKKWFAGLIIPFDTVLSFEIVQRQLNSLEGILGGINSRQLNQANNIHISYESDTGVVLVRFEMLTGVTVMGQARVCGELEDRLRVHKIREKFRQTKTQFDAAQQQADDIPARIEKLASLRDKGILSDAEFEAKKADLLSRM